MIERNGTLFTAKLIFYDWLHKEIHVRVQTPSPVWNRVALGPHESIMTKTAFVYFFNFTNN